jgi:hypothetical protein
VKWWRMNLMSTGQVVATLSTKRILPERHPQASGPLAQVYRIPGRLCWKVTISVSENKSMFLFYLRIIIHISPPLVLNITVHTDMSFSNNHVYPLLLSLKFLFQILHIICYLLRMCLLVFIFCVLADWKIDFCTLLHFAIRMNSYLQCTESSVLFTWDLKCYLQSTW